jgi:hypothetical protein
MGRGKFLLTLALIGANLHSATTVWASPIHVLPWGWPHR